MARRLALYFKLAWLCFLSLWIPAAILERLIKDALDAVAKSHEPASKGT